MTDYQLKAQVSERSDDVFTAIASTATEDRQGEIVDVEGWDIKNYKNNPILLFMHDHTKPLGKATRIWVDKTEKKAKLMFKGFISDATDYGRAAKQLMEEGILNTFSVGFRPLEMDGNRITKSELYEISLVSVPANPDARRLAVKSLTEAGIEESVIKDLLPEEEADDRDDEVQELKDKVLALEDQVALAVKGLQHLNPQRSKRTVDQRLRMAKVVAKAADKLLAEKPQARTAVGIKVIKRSSEMLIRDLKGDL